MKKTIKRIAPIHAYQINDENDLDEFLSEDPNEYRSIGHFQGTVSLHTFSGRKIKFDYGDWLVVSVGGEVKSYSDEDFCETFEILDP